MLPDDKNDYLHAMIDKYALLNSSKNQQRLVVVGGSNVAFGIDSQRMSDVLGIRVINTAVHAGVGLKYTLDDLEAYIKSGDIVLLIPEYQMFYDDKFYGGTETIEAVRMSPKNISNINRTQAIKMLKGYPLYVRSKIGYITLSILGVKKFGDIYFRDSFNSNGDLIAHLDKENVPFDTQCQLDTLNPEVFAYIEKVSQIYSARGAQVLVSYPSLDQSSYEDVRDQLENIDKHLRQMENICVISNYQDYILDHKLFYNSIYHLNKDGRSSRTALLIKDLKKNEVFTDLILNHIAIME